MALQIRQKNYRGKQGFLICGHDTYNRRVSIFTETRSSADRIKTKIKDGQEVGVGDFYA